jgi:hypothetical protein
MSNDKVALLLLQEKVNEVIWVADSEFSANDATNDLRWKLIMEVKDQLQCASDLLQFLIDHS